MNPDPVIESEFMVTATVPLEVTVTDLLTAVPTETLPNAREVVLRLSAGVAAFNWSAALFDEELALPVTVAVWVVLTEETVALNDAVVPPEPTETLAGTFTALLLLVSVTLVPVEGAAELNDTVHDVDPFPVKVVVPQARALTVGAVDPEAFNWSATLFDDEFDVAVKVAVCAVVTEATVAVNDAVVAPDATDTLAGTLSALLLLASVTLWLL